MYDETVRLKASNRIGHSCVSTKRKELNATDGKKEAVTMLWEQGVAGSNPAAPTNAFNSLPLTGSSHPA